MFRRRVIKRKMPGEVKSKDIFGLPSKTKRRKYDKNHQRINTSDIKEKRFQLNDFLNFEAKCEDFLQANRMKVLENYENIYYFDEEILMKLSKDIINEIQSFYIDKCDKNTGINVVKKEVEFYDKQDNSMKGFSSFNEITIDSCESVYENVKTKKIKQIYLDSLLESDIMLNKMQKEIIYSNRKRDLSQNLGMINDNNFESATIKTEIVPRDVRNVKTEIYYNDALDKKLSPKLIETQNGKNNGFHSDVSKKVYKNKTEPDDQPKKSFDSDLILLDLEHTNGMCIKTHYKNNYDNECYKDKINFENEENSHSIESGICEEMNNGLIENNVEHDFNIKTFKNIKQEIDIDKEQNTSNSGESELNEYGNQIATEINNIHLKNDECDDIKLDIDFEYEQNSCKRYFDSISSSIGNNYINMFSENSELPVCFNANRYIKMGIDLNHEQNRYRFGESDAKLFCKTEYENNLSVNKNDKQGTEECRDIKPEIVFHNNQNSSRKFSKSDFIFSETEYRNKVTVEFDRECYSNIKEMRAEIDFVEQDGHKDNEIVTKKSNKTYCSNFEKEIDLTDDFDNEKLVKQLGDTIGDDTSYSNDNFHGERDSHKDIAILVESGDKTHFDYIEEEINGTDFDNETTVEKLDKTICNNFEEENDQNYNFESDRDVQNKILIKHSDKIYFDNIVNDKPICDDTEVESDPNHNFAEKQMVKKC